MFDESVNIGDKVLVVINNEAKEFEVVSTTGDPNQGKISFLSPIAQALLGKKPSQIVTVRLPNGETLDCQLLRISH